MPAPFQAGCTSMNPELRVRTHALQWCILAAVTVAAAGLAGRAEIAWAQRRIVLDPPAGTQEIVADFFFTNRGTQPVHIANVQSGCGCTATVVDRPTVAPNGVGHVRATFYAGQRQGPQKVSLTVTTRQPEQTHNLELEVRLKEFATLAPLARSWRVGDDLKEQIFQLKLASGFNFVRAESSSADFRVEVAERSPELVQLRVSPRDLWSKRSGTIKAIVSQPGQLPLEVTAIVVVQ